ncbi:TolC family outer membrane protein [Candidatus Paracaedibacter symbiosus]|uniref:TolC family outer membrane protein n=1 Tax=Candidatus Paracaedibacter symbiosus TaxID=244582 RepID=UPI00050993D6|nr:TolC family outer membrane protein [Candidatus Paracaedibacter symbiosus]
MMPLNQQKTIFYKTLTLFLTSTVLSGAALAVPAKKQDKPIAKTAEADTTKEDKPIAKTAEVDATKEDKIKAAPLVTFATIAARSGELLGVSKANQFQDSIVKAMESAYKTNPDILAQRAAVRSADENVVQAKAGWRPSLVATGSVGYTKTYSKGKTGTRPVQGSETQTAQLQLTQNLFNGGATTAQIAGAIADIKAQRALLIETEQGTLFAAVQAYLGLITQLAQLEVLRANENFLKVTLQSTQDKFNVGEETRTSVAQAEAQYAEATAKRQSAEANLAAKVATYEQVVGRVPGKLEKPEVPKGLPKTVKEALDRARLNNPTVLKSQFAEIAARRKVDQINGGLLPSLDVQGTSGPTKNRTSGGLVGVPEGGNVVSNETTINHAVTLNLKIPLYEAGTTRSQKRQAIQTAEQNRIQIETARRRIEQLLIQIYQTFVAARDNIPYYEQQVRANEISVEGTKQEMLVGSKILLDVLNAQNQLLNAQLALVQAEQSLYESAYQILVLMGMLTAQYMQLQVEHYDPTLHYREIRSSL